MSSAAELRLRAELARATVRQHQRRARRRRLGAAVLGVAIAVLAPLVPGGGTRPRR